MQKKVVEIKVDNGVVIATLIGEIDHHSAQAMRGEIDATIEKLKPQKLILDFSGIQFMDSSGIGLIMGRFRLMKILGGKVEVTGAKPTIERLIRLAGLERLGVLEKEAVKR